MKRRTASNTGDRIKNMGPKGMDWLRSVGIQAREDLERVGSVEAYRRLKESVPGVNILALYAMEAALWDLHWNELPPHIKTSLHEQVGYTPPGRAGKTKKPVRESNEWNI